MTARFSHADRRNTAASIEKFLPSPYNRLERQGRSSPQAPVNQNKIKTVRVFGYLLRAYEN
jgi:hypothetical protein